jgi:hypothetical protein
LGLKSIRSQGPTARLCLLSGLAGGVAFTVDYVNAVILPVLLLFLLFSKRKSKSSMAVAAGAFVLGALPGLAAIGAYNYAIFGNPLVTTEQAFRSQSSILSSFTTPLYSGLVLDLFSLSRGLFLYTPFLVLGVVGYAEGLRMKAHRLEFFLFLAVFLGILLPYSAWYDPSGGNSFGPRFLVAAIPFLLLPSGFVVEWARDRQVWWVYAAYFVGALMNGIAALVSAIPPTSGWDVSPFFGFILQRLSVGNLNVWWISSVGQYWPYAAGVVVSVGAVLPIAIVELTRRRESEAGLSIAPAVLMNQKVERPLIKTSRQSGRRPLADLTFLVRSRLSRPDLRCQMTCPQLRQRPHLWRTCWLPGSP